MDERDTISVNIDGSSDTVSVHVIYDESSDEDKETGLTLCRDFSNSGIACTNFEHDGKAGSLKMNERSRLIMAATWVIIVCSDMYALSGNNTFSFEENMALFVAVSNRIQNVIYLLEGDTTPLVSKGFSYVSVTDNRKWFRDLKILIKRRPIPITAVMFKQLCNQQAFLQADWFGPLTVLTSTLSQCIEDELSWNVRLKDSVGFTQYTFKLCDDSVKLASKKHVRVPSPPSSVGTECTSLSEVTCTISNYEESLSASTEDINRAQRSCMSVYGLCRALSGDRRSRENAETPPCAEYEVTLKEITASKSVLTYSKDIINRALLKNMTDVQCINSKASSVVKNGGFNIPLFEVVLVFGYGLLASIATSDLLFAGSDTLQPLYLPSLQVTFVVISIMFSICLIGGCRLVKSRELTMITSSTTVLSVIFLVFQILHLVGKLSRDIDIPVGSGALCFLALLSNLSVFMDLVSVSVPVRTYSFGIILFFYILLGVNSPLYYKNANISFKTTIIIMVTLLFCQVGFFKLHIKVCRYFLKKTKMNIRQLHKRVIDALLILVFSIIWMLPSCFVYLI